MEFRQLEYFYAVSKLNSFTRAAEQLHVAQPSITIAINNLEQELKVQLFDRSKRKVVLTDEGKLFLQHVEKILKDVKKAQSELEDLKNYKKGVIKLGIPPMIGAYLFPKIFKGFKNAYPHLELHVREEGSWAMVSLLENGELDLGLIILPEQSENLCMLPITKDQIVLCVSENHRFSQEKRISLRQLEDEQFILLKEDSYTRHKIIALCNYYGFSPNILLSSCQIETIKELVSNGLGITFLMNGITKKWDKIVSIQLEEPMNITIGLAWQKDRCLSRAAQAFIGFVQNYTKSKEFAEIINLET
ncbi:LysR family transcriptional regulator [Carboxydothermus hydrogenoformans]|uniref:Transcriptional regulator, LysR family n=2 Tax=Carboxydothermus TaxID=129957 RepID=Q3AG03_CARHZ|nr:LysR family transcriptional regulator [Carboxydothermus hydrogenoformans]ABB13760.1 transcriptional regulator, LysR family [Carboxydothermus hydrogenoformans Z-2901]